MENQGVELLHYTPERDRITWPGRRQESIRTERMEANGDTGPRGRDLGGCGTNWIPRSGGLRGRRGSLRSVSDGLVLRAEIVNGR